MRRFGLALLCLAFAVGACGKSSTPSSPTSPSSGSLVTVFIKNSVYSPNPVTVKVGQQVNWKNDDPIDHTATLPGMFNNFVNANSAHGAPVTMSSAGTFNYHCTLHPGMNGTIVVQP